SANTLTTLRAGLALIMIGSFVPGLVPWRAGVAGLKTLLIFKSPGRADTPGPFLLTSRLMILVSASKKAPTCFLDNSVSFDSSWKISDLVAALAAGAFAIEFPLKVFDTRNDRGPSRQEGRVERMRKIVNQKIAEKSGYFDEIGRARRFFG